MAIYYQGREVSLVHWDMWKRDATDWHKRIVPFTPENLVKHCKQHHVLKTIYTRIRTKSDDLENIKHIDVLWTSLEVSNSFNKLNYYS